VVRRAAVALIGLLSFLAMAEARQGRRAYHHSSFSDQRDAYLKILQGKHKKPVRIPTDKPVPFGIVTHHFLASELIVEYFETVSSKQTPKRIVLVGPDHFRQGIQDLSLTDLPWQTPFGVLDTDKKTIGVLAGRLGLGLDPGAFSNEHSIGVLVPFIKYYFPDCKLIPVLIRKGVGKENLEALHRELYKLRDEETHFILSTDFSHGKTSFEADEQDERARNVILRQDHDSVWDLDSDCRVGLHLFLRLSSEATPLIVAHTNSARISEKGSANCTSYFTVLYLADEPAVRRTGRRRSSTTPSESCFPGPV